MQPDFATLKPIGTDETQPDFATLKPVAPQLQQSPGIIQSFAQSIARPALKLTSSVSNAAANVIGMGADILGADQTAQKIYASADKQAREGTDYGYLGKVRPFGQTGSATGDLKEAIGTGLELGTTIAGGGSGTAKTLLGKAAQFGGLAATQSVGTDLQSNTSVFDTAKNAFMSGFVGGIIGGGTGLAEKGIKTLSLKAPEAIYNSALKVTQKLKMANKSPSGFLVDKGVWGNLGTFKRAAEEGMANADTLIANKIAKVSGGSTYGEIKKIAIENLQKDIGTDLYSQGTIKEMIDSVPVEKLKQSKILNWKDINDVRSQLGRLIGDNNWLRSNPTEKVKAAQAMYRALASTLQKTTKTQSEFAQYSKWIQTKKVVDRAIDMADNKFGLGLYDLISSGTGAVGGFLSGEGDIGTKIKNSVVGGIGGMAAERTLMSPVLRTGAAQLISKIGKIEPDISGRVSRTAVIKLINDLFSSEDSSANRQ